MAIRWTATVPNFPLVHFDAPRSMLQQVVVLFWKVTLRSSQSGQCGKYQRHILIVGMQVRVVMRRAQLNVHANDDTEETRYFRHGFFSPLFYYAPTPLSAPRY